MRKGRVYPENSRQQASGDAGGAIGAPVSPECVADGQERLWESFDAFEAVQREHRHAFASGRCDQLMARRAEREKALARLQMELEAAHHQLLVAEDGGFANRLRARFAALIELETALANSARQTRIRMRDELAAIRQGKRVLQGYGQHHGGSPQPRFLNSKT